MSNTEEAAKPLPPAGPEQSERLHRYSHGLRNKLTGMFEALRLLQSETDPALREEIGTYAEIQFFQALRDTELMLDDFGVERGIGRLQSKPHDLTKLVHDALKHSAHRLEKKGQQVDVEMAERLTVSGDAYYLEEVLLSLISNASKFSHRGDRIALSVVKEGASAVIAVRDTGVGLDAEDLQGVFRRFAWLRSRSTAGEAQGRGSLSRVKGWIEKHGGTITAESEGPGKGATFLVRLPLAS